MRQLWIFLLQGLVFAICLLLAGCNTSTPVVEVLVPSPTSNPFPSKTPISVGLVMTLTPTDTMTPTATLAPSATLSALTQPPFQVCSPLARETIPELFEIVSDPYKPPPPSRAEERHHGVDFSHYSRKGFPGIEGESVQSILPGVVAASIHNRLPYGNMVIIETVFSEMPAQFAQAIELQEGRSLYVLYAHFKQAPLVSLGDKVACGQVLGEVGAVGYNVVNAHLHLETRRGSSGAIFPSMAFYTTTASIEEMENYTRWRTGGEFVHFDPMIFFQKYLDWLLAHS